MSREMFVSRLIESVEGGHGALDAAKGFATDGKYAEAAQKYEFAAACAEDVYQRCQDHHGPSGPILDGSDHDQLLLNRADTFLKRFWMTETPWTARHRA